MRSLLDAPIYGGLNDLRWTAAPRAEPSEGEVEISVAVTGLNDRDVIWSIDRLPAYAVAQGFAGSTIGWSARVPSPGSDLASLAL